MVAQALSFSMSPGVYYKETNISQYVQTLSSTIVALIGVAPRGVMDSKTFVSSLSDLITKFGFPSAAYPMLLAAREFFNAGGSQLWITRVGRGEEVASTVVDLIDSTSFTLNALTSGPDFNLVSLSFSNGGPKSTSHSQTLSIIITATQSFTITMPNVPLIPRTILIMQSTTKVAQDDGVSVDGVGQLVFETGNTGYTGTVNYNTGVISITVAGAPAVVSRPLVVTANYNSTFGLQVLETPVNVSTTIQNSLIVEEWINLTPATFLAQTINSNYFTAEANPTTFPKEGVYALSGGTDGADDVTDADFVGDNFDGVRTGLQTFSTNVDINVVAIPGVSSAPVRQALDQFTSIQRRDCFAPVDPYLDDTTQSVVDWANGTGIYNGYGVLNSTYMAIYFPWTISFNNITNALEATPPTAAILGALAQSDFTQAPAGPNRGVLLNCLSTAVDLDQGDRDYLYANRINPISNLNGLGIMVLGQKTSTIVASALQSVKNRIFLMRIEKAITTALYSLLMEDDNDVDWNQAINLCQPYLTGYVSQGKLQVGKFICDITTNPVDLQNQNTMGAAVILTFTPTIESIRVNFVVTAIGANITEIPQSTLLAA